MHKQNLARAVFFAFCLTLTFSVSACGGGGGGGGGGSPVSSVSPETPPNSQNPVAPQNPEETATKSLGETLSDCATSEREFSKTEDTCIDTAFKSLQGDGCRNVSAKTFYIEAGGLHGDRISSLFDHISTSCATFQRKLPSDSRRGYAASYKETPKDSLVSISASGFMASGDSDSAFVRKSDLLSHGCIVTSAGNEGLKGPLVNTQAHPISSTRRTYIKAAIATEGTCFLYVARSNLKQTETFSTSNGCFDVEEFCLHAPGGFNYVVKGRGGSFKQTVHGTSVSAPYTAVILANAWAYLPGSFTARQVVEMTKACVFGFAGTPKAGAHTPGGRLDLGCVIEKINAEREKSGQSTGTRPADPTVPLPKNPLEDRSSLHSRLHSCQTSEREFSKTEDTCIDTAFKALQGDGCRNVSAKTFYIEAGGLHGDRISSLFDHISTSCATFQRKLPSDSGQGYATSYKSTPKDSLVSIAASGFMASGDSDSALVRKSDLLSHGCIVTSTGNEGLKGPLVNTQAHPISSTRRTYIKAAIATEGTCFLYVAQSNLKQTETVSTSNGCFDVEEFCLHAPGSFSYVVKGRGGNFKQRVQGTSVSASYAAVILANAWAYLPSSFTARQVVEMTKACVFGFAGTEAGLRYPGGRLDLGCIINKIDAERKKTSQSSLSRDSIAKIIGAERVGKLSLPGSSKISQAFGIEGDSLSLEYNPTLDTENSFSPSVANGHLVRVNEQFGMYLDEKTQEMGFALSFRNLNLIASQFKRNNFFGGNGTGIYSLKEANYARGMINFNHKNFSFSLYGINGKTKGANAINQISGREIGTQLELSSSTGKVDKKAQFMCSQFVGGKISLSNGKNFDINSSPRDCRVSFGFFVPFKLKAKGNL